MMKVLCIRAVICESGATGMEYALIAAVISVALLTGADTIGDALNDKFMSLSKKLDVASRERGQLGGGTSLISLQYPAEKAFSETSTQSQSLSY